MAVDPVEALAEVMRLFGDWPETVVINRDADILLRSLHARGYRLVPEAPTEEMIEAGEDNMVETFGTDLNYVWRGMLDAAPGAPKKEEQA